jgi:hypothetical protein
MERRTDVRERFDHDAHKAELMEPLDGAMTFLYLMQQQAAIDLSSGTDPVVRWRAAKAFDLDLEREQRRHVG